MNPNATAVGGIYGYSHTCGGYDGGEAEFVRVPFADVGPAITPDWMSDEDALMRTRTPSNRVDKAHNWIDPLIVGAPYLLGGVVAANAVRAVRRRAHKFC
ncbi:hypothetical protein A5651_05245 [Mycobacterium sp. 1274761.0]|nr:hypothetical protein A5651_05245 [Mycobacterium sp. 1274761.0]